MSFEPRNYLRHILVEVEYLLDQSQTLTYERFAADETLRRAFVRSLEILDEGACDRRCSLESTGRKV